uniref:Tubulin tyrosine ligase-like family, member 3 n=1 Tax=Callorhinchus milii TaxID=7868 RepID=A0A4W3IM22_CALMI
MINHYVGAGSFTTKAGLCVNLRNFQWFHQVNPDIFFPRCYRLAAAEEKQAFIEDFRLTTARNILKWVVEQKKKNDHILTENKNQKEESVSSGKKGTREEGTHLKANISLCCVVISSQLVQTAVLACEEHLNYLEHKDIDVSLDAPPAITEECWDRIIQQYYQVIHNGAMIQDWSSYVGVCTHILRQLQAASPQMDMEGMHNIWIVKPGAQSRGRGITCMNRLEEILKVVCGEASIFSEGKWVVQKYIENPLLIYGTKFDVRQWFLVTDWNPVTIWFYKDCYLRFSSQPFSLKNLDISIHLCNNSIQRRCENSSSRHPMVPTDNMWTSEQFKDYLRKNGKGSMWEHIISPGMKKAIIHTMQMVQDGMKPRKNSFELYGADFLIGKDYIPWLIEINCSPTMSPSTAVTAMLCTNVQEDTIKVVVDRRNERTCDIGRFELLYRQPVMDIPLYIGINLLVEGSCIRKPRPPVQKNVTTIWLGNTAQNP